MVAARVSAAIVLVSSALIDLLKISWDIGTAKTSAIATESAARGMMITAFQTHFVLKLFWTSRSIRAKRTVHAAPTHNTR